MLGPMIITILGRDVKNMFGSCVLYLLRPMAPSTKVSKNPGSSDIAFFIYVDMQRKIKFFCLFENIICKGHKISVNLYSKGGRNLYIMLFNGLMR